MDPNVLRARISLHRWVFICRDVLANDTIKLVQVVVELKNVQSQPFLLIHILRLLHDRLVGSLDKCCFDEGLAHKKRKRIGHLTRCFDDICELLLLLIRLLLLLRLSLRARRRLCSPQRRCRVVSSGIETLWSAQRDV